MNWTSLLISLLLVAVAVADESGEPVPESSGSVPDSIEPVPESSESVPDSIEPVPESSESIPDSIEPVPESSESVPDSNESVPDSNESAPDSNETAPESNESVDDSSESSEEGLQLAEPCYAEACQLPDCRCSSTDIPGGLAPRDTPQFVLVTFDDGVNVINIETYRDILYRRFNSNNCPASATFYINHQYTNYQLVNELYNNGFEIALHSITHQTPQSYWAEATFETMMKEFGDQRVQMSHFANIPYDEIKGMRIPFLQMAGNSSFEMMAEVGLTYDASWPTINAINPGLWPYTLDFASTQDCIIPPCPTASIPGPWVLPMISWLDTNGSPCSMADGCFWAPDMNDEEAWFQFIVSNFERHYLGTRAPFGYYVHEWYVSANPAVRNALVRFMDLINTLNDVFMVNSAEVINWVKDPVPLNEYLNKPCRTFTPTFCPVSNCELVAEHNQVTYWMAACNTCPRTYPWLGNPLGQ